MYVLLTIIIPMPHHVIYIYITISYHANGSEESTLEQWSVKWTVWLKTAW